MMIEFGEGNLLKAQADALVNTVNTVGVMGKGIALQFKQAFPDNYKAYRRACKHGEVKIGRMLVWDSGQFGAQRYIINFPTKQHWRSKSRLADIESGLDELVRVVHELEISSIALPALGCGNGGLDWNAVLPTIEKRFSSTPVRAIVFPPTGAPSAVDMPVRTRRPPMTFGRAALIAILENYSRAAQTERFDLAKPGASLLEIQKLMYFLQESGQPLRLNFEKGRYGPYAENLLKVLEVMEGHYIRGYGDRSRAVLNLDPIELLPGAEDAAEEWLEDHPDVKRDVDRVLRLTAGWETAYGMELLATVLFAMKTDPQAASDVDRAAAYVHAWNARKQANFPKMHVERAWQHLRALGWTSHVVCQ